MTPRAGLAICAIWEHNVISAEQPEGGVGNCTSQAKHCCIALMHDNPQRTCTGGIRGCLVCHSQACQAAMQTRVSAFMFLTSEERITLCLQMMCYYGTLNWADGTIWASC